MTAKILPLEVQLCMKYKAKYHDCIDRGIEFKLSFAAFKKLKTAKLCYYTGLKMSDDAGYLKRTIDRIDSSKGYTVKNCVPCCDFANTFKSRWEDPDSPINVEYALSIITKTLERTNENKDKE